MTESQRRVHLIVWLILGPVAVAMVIVAIVARPAPALGPARAGLPAAGEAP
jgi:hypothetical protein